MAELKHQQEEILKQIKSALANFKKTPKARLNKIYVEVKLSILEELWIKFSNNHLLLVSGDTRSEDYSKKDYHYEAEEAYTLGKCEMLEVLQKFTPISDSAQSSEASTHPTEIKLPRINLPTFSGNYSEWISFHDLFVTLIHDNATLKNVQRLHYLKSSLRGEAEALLRHIPVTDSNYDDAWSTLKKRYNHKRFIVNELLKRLMSQKPVTSESSKSLKSILDITNECLNSLKNLGIAIKYWDPILVYIVVSKLDTESVRLWEQHVTNHEDNGDELPSYIQLCGFIESRFRTLEVLESSTSKPISRSNTRQAFHAAMNACCSFCKGNHQIYHCKEFINLDYTDRKKFIENNGLCYNCLGPYHSVYKCKQSTSCRRCGRRHHSLIHPDNTIPEHSVDESNREQKRDTTPVENNNVETYYTDRCFTSVLLATALVKIYKHDGSVHYLRALIDQGSQGSFITESATQVLGLKKIPINCTINGLGEKGRTLNSNAMVTFQAYSRCNQDYKTPIRAYVLKSLTRMLPTTEVDTRAWPTYLRELDLADPTYAHPGRVDLLLGADVYSDIITEGLRKGPTGYPIAQNSHLGWILSGQINTTEAIENRHPNNYNITLSMHTYIEENNLLQKFWELESDVPCERILTEEENKCEKHFDTTHKREQNGRYTVSLPFKNSDPACQYGSSRTVAMTRLLQLERRLAKDTSLREEYSKVINEYVELKHMEEIKDQEERYKPTAVYLPHHAVIRNDKTTSQVRVVFDASCKYKNNVSLNDDLMVGPRLQQDLKHIIMRWRQYKVCLVADIIKMYRQIYVNELDFQRILWRDDPNDEVKDYRMNRVTFGTASAPYLATKVLHQLAHDESEMYPKASKITLKDYYMDDLLSGSDDLDESIDLNNQMTGLLESGGFQLQKWNSNNVDLLKLMNHSTEDNSCNKELNLDMTIKTLGIAWNNKRDQFQYTINLTELKPIITKRTIASEVSKLFDPMGWLAPTIILGKVFLQRIWLAGIMWDQEVPQAIKDDWLKYRSELPCLSNITIDRWLHTTNNTKMELHGFADASMMAYAAVVYSRVHDAEGKIYIQLISAKTKVAPIKTVSVPRLELCGAVLLTRLLNETSKHLNISKENIYAYTDSQVVLTWLQGHPSKWKTFVANRTSEILTTLPSQHWSHVTSGENPADIASRGVTGSMLNQETLWWKGPKWLEDKEITRKRPNSILKDDDMEESREAHFTNISEDVKETFTNIFSKYSTLEKLLRVIAWCKRFKPTIKRNFPDYLTAEELSNSLITCIRLCQEEEFPIDMKTLRENQALKIKSKLRSLNPFLDTKGILRVGGRLKHANIPENAKHQIILPNNNPLVKLIIAQSYRKTLHGGPTLMLNYIRQQFWILGGRSMINQEVHRCITCVRQRAATQTQLMADLPKQRVTPTRPFLHSGVDFAGPIDLRMSKGRGCKTYKGYICIFICMSTRAIHIEIVSGLDSQSFVASFKRFTARRGHCSHIWSDNGTNFIAGNKLLQEMLQGHLRTVEREIYDQLSRDGTTWHNIPASAPHFGGLWEAGVRSIKHHLKRILGNSTLTYEEMSTVTTQIEACLNSRPISQISDNVEDLLPLTPGHFLIGETPIVVPEHSYLDTNITSLSRWQLVQRVVQHFWDRWSTEYLSRLQQRPKWVKQIDRKIETGMLVLVKEDNLPPGKWSLARIVNIHPGSDGLIRVVSLKYKNSIVTRPITKVCLLPVEVDSSQS